MTSVDLTRFNRKLEHLDILPCKGKVVGVTGLTVESQGPPVGMGRLCAICLADGRRILAEVVGFNNHNRILLPLEATEGISPGDYVVAVMTHRHIMLDDSVLGRVLDGLGRPIDDKGPLAGKDPQPLDNPVVPAMNRPPIREALAFGVRAFAGLLTCGKGQRLGIFAGSGVGKSTLLGEIARNSQADVTCWPWWASAAGRCGSSLRNPWAKKAWPGAWFALRRPTPRRFSG